MAAALVQPVDEFLAPGNPEHVEAAQHVDGQHAGTGALLNGGQFRRFSGIMGGHSLQRAAEFTPRPRGAIRRSVMNGHTLYYVTGNCTGLKGTDMDWRERISWNPEICHGKACIKGTRVMVSVILDNLAEGESIATILKEYPSVNEQDVLAAIAYASEIIREEQYAPFTRGAA